VIFVALEGETAALPGLYPLFSYVSARRPWIANDLFVTLGVRELGFRAALREEARRFAMETGTKGLTLATPFYYLAAQRL